MSPVAAPGRASPLPPVERRAAIIAATEPLLIRFGTAVTTRQIAEAAGVAEGTIFRVFVDKDDLLDATVEAVLDSSQFEVELRAVDARLGPEAELEARLVAAVGLVGERISHVWRVLSALDPQRRERASRPLPDSPALVSIFESARDEFRVEPVQAARILRSLTLSTTHPMLAVDPLSPADIVAVLLGGIGSKR